MRLLVDNALSPVLAEFLRNAGHEAVHVRDIGLHHAADEDVFERAAAEDFVVVTADTDFGTLLARRSTSKPSLILFHGEGSRKPEAQGIVHRDLKPANIKVCADGSPHGSAIPPARP
jgi:predicted nuclease of predicted toxin-antitoxin system